MPNLSDPHWLRDCVASGAAVDDIAAAAGRRPRTVYTALRRYGIATPARHRRGFVDRAAVAAAWRRGDRVDDIGEAHHRSAAWVRLAMREVPRDVTPRSRPRRSRFPLLNDPEWLAIQLADGRSIHSIARQLGTDRHNVMYMLRRHGLR